MPSHSFQVGPKLRNAVVGLRRKAASARQAVQENTRANRASPLARVDLFSPHSEGIELMRELDRLDARADRALALFQNHDLEEAVSLQREVVEGRRALQGPMDPATLTAQADLGLFLGRRLREAGQLGQALIHFGAAEHQFRTPETWNLNNAVVCQEEAARIFERLGQHERSHDLLESVLPEMREVWGPKAQSVLTVQTQLIALKEKLGRSDDAIACQRDLVDRLGTAFGYDDPQTLDERGELAVKLYDLGDPVEAVMILRPVYDAYVMRGEADSVSAVGVLNNLATFLETLDPDEALAVAHQAAEDSVRVLGAADPDTHLTRLSLSTMLLKQSRVDEAITLLKAIVHDSTIHNGSLHPSTLRALSRLAVAMGRGPNPQESTLLHQRAWEGLVTALGEEDPDTLKVEERLAGALWDAGEDNAALRHQLHVADMYSIGLGSDDPAALRAHRDLEAMKD